MMDFADFCNILFTLKHDIEKILDMWILLRMITPRKFLFDVLTKAACATENRFMIYTQLVKDAYQTFEFTDIAYVGSENKNVDALTRLSLLLSWSIHLETEN